MISLVKKLLSMLETKENMEQTDGTNDQVYVWIRSERAGDVVTIDESKNDSKWIYFTDGTRLNRQLKNEYLMEAKNEDLATDMASSFKAPAETNVQTPSAEVASVHAVETKVTSTKPELDEDSVMLSMLRKMSKKHTAEMPVNVNLPSPAMHLMLVEEMDVEADELDEYIGSLIESQIDNMRDQLRGQIKSFIQNYYNDGTTGSDA